jgi:hypothetical protein
MATLFNRLACLNGRGENTNVVEGESDSQAFEAGVTWQISNNRIHEEFHPLCLRAQV